MDRAGTNFFGHPKLMFCIVCINTIRMIWLPAIQWPPQHDQKTVDNNGWWWETEEWLGIMHASDTHGVWRLPQRSQKKFQGHANCVISGCSVSVIFRDFPDFEVFSISVIFCEFPWIVVSGCLRIPASLQLLNERGGESATWPLKKCSAKRQKCN